MSQETLDLRRSIRIVRRHKLLLGVMVTLGILAGGAYAVAQTAHGHEYRAGLAVHSPGKPQQAGAQAAANGGPDPYTATQLVIAKSNPVLLGALPHVQPGHVDRSASQRSSDRKPRLRTSFR